MNPGLFCFCLNCSLRNPKNSLKYFFLERGYIGFFDHIIIDDNYRSRFAKIHALGLDDLVFSLIILRLGQFFYLTLKFFASFSFAIRSITDKNKFTISCHLWGFVVGYKGNFFWADKGKHSGKQVTFEFSSQISCLASCILHLASCLSHP